MAEPSRKRTTTAALPIDPRAQDHLRYIRETMARAAEFTAVPGWGGVAMGLTALAAAWIAHRQATPRAWLTVWLVEAFVAVAIAAATAATKAHRVDSQLFSGPGRKFVLSFAPPIVAGGLLTFALVHAGAVATLPGVWLLLYGAAIVTGGAFSVRVVPVMGLCLMAMGTAAILSPADWGDWFMAGGFGIVQMIFGYLIALRFGGEANGQGLDSARRTGAAEGRRAIRGSRGCAGGCSAGPGPADSRTDAAGDCERAGSQPVADLQRSEGAAENDGRQLERACAEAGGSTVHRVRKVF